jgi:hypothetical protein
MLGAGDSFKCHVDLLPDHSPLDVIAKADAIDPLAFFRGRLQELGESGDLPRGEWPSSVTPSTEIGIHMHTLSKKPLPEVFLVLTPVPEPWRAVAHVPFGGWNECPMPEEHVAVFRHWATTHGAEPVGISKDTIECMVVRPPATRQAAMDLALEQYAYASDIVDQGTETIDALAATLLDGTAWFFWWD